MTDLKKKIKNDMPNIYIKAYEIKKRYVILTSLYQSSQTASVHHCKS